MFRLLSRDYSSLDDYAKKIRAIDPLDSFSNGMIANLYLYSNQLEKAQNICSAFNKVSAATGYITMVGIFVNGFKDGWHTVIPALEQIQKEYGSFPMLMSTLGLAYIKNSEEEKAHACISWFKETEKQQPGIALDHVAVIYANLGMTDEFFETTEHGIANGSIVFAWLYKSPFLPDYINYDERMRKIRMKMGLPL